MMTVVPLRLSDQLMVTLPAELARQAGLSEGNVEVVLGETGLTVLPGTPSTDYTARWEIMAATLREQTPQLDLFVEDRRDQSYWEIVAPLFEEAARTVGST
jgi:hypothetical protein